MDKQTKQTNKRKEYVTNPARIVSFIVFVFWLGVAYATITSRISNVEAKVQDINVLEIQTTLSSIQKDIERIKLNLTTNR